MLATGTTPIPPKHVAVVGAGGNIGSSLVGHVARMRSVTRIALIDYDYYEPGNLLCQNINAIDIGRPKVHVQAGRIAAIRPDIHVDVYEQRVETLPRGVLAVDVILACLDNLSARQAANEAAFRLGIPWIDSGIRASELLARVNVYTPDFAAPCLECAWSQADYDRLEQEYPCQQGVLPAAPTNASSSLGALAASWQALECEKLLAPNPENSLSGQQILIDARTGKLYLTRMLRNNACRFDHRRWRPIARRFPLRETTVDGLLAGLPIAGSGGGVATLGLEGAGFTRSLFCLSCRKESSVLALTTRLSRATVTCASCGRPMRSSGAAESETLSTSEMSAAERSLSVYSIGFRHRDIITVHSPGTRPFHCEIRDDSL